MRRTKVLLIVSRAAADREDYDHLLAMLRATGFELTTEDEEDRPDVVLMDLPRSPRELAALLARAATAKAPLIVASRDKGNLARKARALGAYGYLPKPFQAAEVMERLGSAAEACRRHPTLFGWNRRR